MRYRWSAFLVTGILVSIFAVFVLSLLASAEYTGDLSVESVTTVSGLLLTVQGILVGLAIFMDKTKIRAAVVYFGIIGVVSFLATVLDGNYYLRKFPGIALSQTRIALIGINISLADEFRISIFFLLLTLTGYGIDVILDFWK